MEIDQLYQVMDFNSPYSFLEQRLQYAYHSIKNPIILSSNTPQWSIGEFETVHLEPNILMNYAPSNGIPELLEIISQREKLKYNLQIEPSEVLVTNGALHGISLILRSLYYPKAVALCQSPVLTHIEGILSACGYKIIFFSIDNEDLDCNCLPQEIKENIQVILINIPNNPIGKVGTKETVSKLIYFADKYKANLVADLVYDEFVFSGNKLFNPLALQNNWHNTYVVNSISKSFGMPGIRIGWIISNERNIKSLAGMLETGYIAVSSYGQEQAVHIIKQGNQSLVRKVTNDLDNIGNYLSKIPGIRFSKPEGGTQYFVELPVQNIERFADFMLVEYGVVLATSGNYKGLDKSYKNNIRIPLGQPNDTMLYGIESLSKGLRKWWEICRTTEIA